MSDPADIEKPVYLDYNATTPLDPRVFDVMAPYFVEHFGNAASHQHPWGRVAFEAVESARDHVAHALGADPREIVWTSGATESANLALKGVAASKAYRGRDHILTVATEHKAVLDTCEGLAERGFRCEVLPVDAFGHIDLDRLKDAIGEKTLLVSVMHANNEIGVLHPIEEIGRLCRENGVLFHTDASQSFGKLALDVEAMNLDLVSLSGHKIYGPKGIGALYVRRKRPRVRCEPLIDGGGHERGMRSGTLNVTGIVGLGEAARLGTAHREENGAREKALRDRLERALIEGIGGVVVNGCRENRLPTTTNLSFEGTSAEAIMERMSGIGVSTSSACTSASRQPSYVLAALGADEDRIRASLRFSVGRMTAEQDIERAIPTILRAVQQARREEPATSD